VQFGGTQYVAETELQDRVLQEFAQIAPQHGYHVSLLDQKQSLELNPSLQPSYTRSSVLFPDDLRFDPRTLPKLLLPWLAKERRVSYQPGTVATGVRINGDGCEITTTRGEQYFAKHVFICSGSDLQTLFPEFLKPLRYCKLQMMRTAPQPRVKLNASLGTGLTIRRYPAFSLAPSWQLLQEEGKGNELDRWGIHILIVQDPDTRLVLGDSHEYSETPFDESINPHIQKLILDETQRILKLDSTTLEQEWSGVYTIHPERDILRETIEGRIHLVTGIGGKGMTTSAGVAEANILKLR
jgi:FAD dependent oxidoreductase TIGR03364